MIYVFFFYISVNNIRSNTHICPFELYFETNANACSNRDAKKRRSAIVDDRLATSSRLTRAWVKVVSDEDVVARANR